MNLLNLIKDCTLAANSAERAMVALETLRTLEQDPAKVNEINDSIRHLAYAKLDAIRARSFAMRDLSL